MPADATDALLDAAERIGAEQGLAAMSIRAVQAASGQRNNSAVQYYFGGRDGLIEAVVARHMGPVNERRTELLLGLPGDPSLRTLVEVLVVPIADEVRSRPGFWARFVMQAMLDPSTTATAQRPMENPASRAVHTRILDQLGHLPAALAARRLTHAQGLMLLGLAVIEAGDDDRGLVLPVLGAALGVLDPADAVAELVDMVLGVLQAPSTAASPDSADSADAFAP